MDVLILIALLWIFILGGCAFLIMHRWTNFFTELQCFLHRVPVINFIYKTGNSIKRRPKRVWRGFAFFDNPETNQETAYLMFSAPTGKTREAIVFEDLTHPFSYSYMRSAAELKKLGFSDYTEVEVAIFLKLIEEDYPEISGMKWGDNLDVRDAETGEKIHYNRLVDFLQEEFIARGGNPWFAAIDEIKRAREKNLVDKVTGNVIDLYSNMHDFATHNASAAVYEDMLMNARIKEKYEAQYGHNAVAQFVKTHWIEIGCCMFLILLGLFFFNNSGGFGRLMPQAAKVATTLAATTTTTTLSTPINM